MYAIPLKPNRLTNKTVINDKNENAAIIHAVLELVKKSTKTIGIKINAYKNFFFHGCSIRIRFG